MKPAIKWLLALLGFFIFVPALVVLVLSLLIDESHIKQAISELGSEYTKGQLTINGPVSWSLYPTLGIELNDTSFRLPQHRHPEFAHADKAKLGIQLAPLFDGELIIDGLQLDGIQLQLHEIAPGHYNFQDIIKAADKDPDSTPSTQAETTPALPLGLAANKLVISNSSIAFTNLKGEKQYQLENLFLSSDGFNSLGQAFPIKLEFSSHETFAANISLSAELSWQAQQSLQFADLQLHYQPQQTNDTQTPDIKISASGVLNSQTNTLSAPQWTMIIGKLQLNGSELSLQSGKTNRFTTQLQSNHFDLPELLTSFGQELPGSIQPEAFKKVQLQATLSGTDSRLALQKLVLSTEQLTLRGSIQSDLDANRHQFNFQGGQLNLDKLLVQPDQSVTGQATNKARDETPLSLPLEQLRGLNGTIVLGLDQLTWSGLQFEQAIVDMSATKGLLTLKKFNAALYKGQINISGALDARPAQAQLTVNTRASGLPLQPLLTTLEKTSALNGISTISANLTARGNNTVAWRNTLKGPVDYWLSDVLFTGLSLEQKVCEAVALIRNTTLSKTWPAETRLDQLQGKLHFNRGIASHDRFTAAVSNLVIQGRGQINLPDESFDYRLGAKIQGDLSEEEPACAVNVRYRDVAWPIRCHGKFADDSGNWCKIDQQGIGKLIEDAAKKRVEEELQDVLQKGLESLFK
jgi:AsmA protein